MIWSVILCGREPFPCFFYLRDREEHKQPYENEVKYEGGGNRT